MEVKIGVKYATRELSIDIEDSQDDVLQQLKDSGEDDLFTLSDAKGRTIAVPVDKVIYLAFAEENLRKVGFAK